ncbi:MAG: hypothetical protein U5K56_09920 [Halioglobus sp.]|nr:hypothetical protein [Halioglobus sp.]
MALGLVVGFAVGFLISQLTVTRTVVVPLVEGIKILRVTSRPAAACGNAMV